MTGRELLRQLGRLWRIPVVAVLAAALAFAASYVNAETYEASTRLLIRGRDATFLTSTGQTLANQPGVIDSTLASALSQTQAALLSTRTVATQVVDELGLDEPREPETGMAARARSLVGGLYRDAKAMLIHGYVADVDPRTRAIEAVHGGLAATQVEDSYVMEVSALADSPVLAAAIADAAADALVEGSRERFRTETATYRDFLREQVDRARTDADAAAAAVHAFKAEHGISDLAFELELTATSIEQVRSDLEEAQVLLDENSAALGSVRASLASTSATDRSVQNIETGRSSTSIVNEGANSVYQSLVAERERLEAEQAALTARITALTRLRDASPEADGALTEEEAELRQLEVAYTAAADTYQTLDGQYQQAVLASADDRVEVTRVDAAVPPVYPIAPKRYLYLALGLLAGAALGLALTVLRARREGWLGPPPAPEGDADRTSTTPSDDETIVIDRDPVGVGAPGNGTPDGRTRLGRFEAYRAPESEQ